MQKGLRILKLYTALNVNVETRFARSVTAYWFMYYDCLLCTALTLSYYLPTHMVSSPVSDPPENVTVTNKIVNVTMNNIPPRVLCSAKAFPEASFNWSKEGDTEIIRGNALILNFPVTKNHAGNYLCTAYNKHGSNTQTTFLNVLCELFGNMLCYTPNGHPKHTRTSLFLDKSITHV